MKKIVIFLIVIFIFSSVAFADFRQVTKSEKIVLNPKQVDYIRVRIIQSGSLLVSGSIGSATVLLYTPQEGAESLSVESDAKGLLWKTVNDSSDNRQLYMEWENPSGKVSYRVETVVANRAKLLPSSKALANAPEYLRENQQIVFTDEMRRIAYPYENSLEKAAELTKWVHNYIDYDLDIAGQLKPSDWVLANRRGVCVEYANMLSSLLKLAGIPNRYVVGYAYSSVENKFIGHTWVEVLAADGTWIPFDATWLQAGYVDATHIKTANREDANQTELLTYFGIGSVLWQRNDDDIQIMDYTLKNITKISLETKNISFGENGFIKATVQTETCTISDLAALPCLGGDGKELLDILDAKRQLWHCGPADAYWFFSARDLDKDYIYTCPISVFDQAGADSKAVIKIQNGAEPEAISISGPDVVSVGEKFSLVADADGDFIFYSPNLTRHSGKAWELSLPKPGTYKFYLHSDGALAAKDVRAAEKKEFDIALSVPKNITRGSSFIAAVVVKNLEGKQKQATIRIEFDDVAEDKTTFAPDEMKTLSYNITATTGRSKITASAASNSIASYTAYITVYEKEQEAGIIKFFYDIFAAIANFFGSLFRR